MKVKVISRYNDLERGGVVEPGAEFEVTKQRAELLQNRGFVEPVIDKVKLEPKK